MPFVERALAWSLTPLDVKFNVLLALFSRSLKPSPQPATLQSPILFSRLLLPIAVEIVVNLLGIVGIRSSLTRTCNHLVSRRLRMGRPKGGKRNKPGHKEGRRRSTGA